MLSIVVWLAQRPQSLDETGEAAAGYNDSKAREIQAITA